MSLFVLSAITLLVPKDGISARLGDEASLPCWVTPATNAEDMEVRWYQTFDNPVLLYRDKKIQIPSPSTVCGSDILWTPDSKIRGAKGGGFDPEAD